MTQTANDLVERLRTMNISISHEAADEIERLRALVTTIQEDWERAWVEKCPARRSP